MTSPPPSPLTKKENKQETKLLSCLQDVPLYVGRFLVVDQLVFLQSDQGAAETTMAHAFSPPVSSKIYAPVQKGQ